MQRLRQASWTDTFDPPSNKVFTASQLMVTQARMTVFLRSLPIALEQFHQINLHLPLKQSLKNLRSWSFVTEKDSSADLKCECMEDERNQMHCKWLELLQ